MKYFYWSTLLALLVAPSFSRGQNVPRTAISTSVVISQVYGGGGNTGAPYTHDFIELHNVSSAAVSLAGYSVQYTSATGTSWQATSLSGSISAGGYYLVQQAAGNGNGVALPTPNATGTLALSGTAGKVALVSSTTALSGSCPTAGVVDLVGYGNTANCAEGNAPAPAPSNTTSVSRAADGCTDTDNNASDFAAGTPAPRNNATTAVVCAAPATPTVSGLAPATGPEGTQFTVTGTNLSGIRSVTVGGVAASGIAVMATTVTATVATSTPIGAQAVVLSTGSATYAGGTFTVTSPVAPTVTGMNPISGPVGTVVTLTGTGFVAGTSINFNGTAATAVTVVSATQLTAAVPAGATTGYVTVTTAGGTAGSPGGFTVTRPTVELFDDFARADGPAVGFGWQETETTATGASLGNGQLKFSSGMAGREFVTQDVSARYGPVIGTGRPLTWAWNMQQSRPNPSGFDAGSYGVAFVLAASSADLLMGTGYAVVLGNSSTPDPLKLVRYSGGLGANARLTTILTTSTDYTNKPLTLRVTYDPSNDQWTLAAGTTTTAFTDPGTANYLTLGAAFDDTYANIPLPYVGLLWNHATSASDYALFDNVYLTSPCDLNAEPAAGPSAVTATPLTSSTAHLDWGASPGSTRVVVLRAGRLPAAAPADGTTYRASADLAAGSLLALDEYIVSEGANTSVDLTGLQPNTTYYYRIYDGDGMGCATNYRAAASAEGSFVTPPCVLAAAPTQPARFATATVAGSYALTLAWQAGDGAASLVVLRSGQAPGAAPANGTGYAANARFGAGAAVIPDEYVVYNGAGTTVTVTGLVPGRTYYAAVYTFNGSGCEATYLTAAPATSNVTLPVPPPASYRFYRGNLHAHSSYSDGNKDAATSGASTPADDYVLARQAMQFDFLGISEHNHGAAGMSLPSYARGLQQADQATQDGTFLALYGMEWGTISGGGHVIIYGYDQLLGWEAGNYDVYTPKGDYTTLFATVAQQPGAVAYLAHPSSSDYNNFFTTPRNVTSAQAIVGLAMRSGPAFSTATDYSDPSSSTYEARYKDALKLGYHVGPTMDHDNHNSVFGRTSYSRLVVLAPQLTRTALLEALQQRRFYAADDYNAEVTLTVAGQPMGAQLTLSGAPTLQVTVNDPDNEAVSSIVLVAGIPGSGTAATTLTTMTGSTSLTYTDDIPNGATYYYYAVITQADGDKIWTAPIRYTRNDAATPLPVTLISFRAVLQGESQAVLRWATAQEKNSAYYIVERSGDGQAFSEVGRVAAAGQSTTARTYEWRDPQPLRQLTYYRLRQVDTDGSLQYSHVATLAPQQGEAKLAQVFPNPTAGQAVRLALRGYQGQTVQVRVTDVLGHAVLTQTVTPGAYLSEQELYLPARLTPGVYSVQVQGSGKRLQLRLLVTY